MEAAAQGRPRVVMALDTEDKTGLLGCLGALAALAALAVGVVLLVQSGPSSPERPQAAAVPAQPSQRAAAKPPETKPPITKIEPAQDKTVVEKAAGMEALGRYIPPEGDSDTAPPTSPSKGVIAAVEGLQPLGPPPALGTPEYAEVQQVLDAEPLCWRGRIARRAASLFTPYGFAVTYGADSFNEGDPLPRLEIFLTQTGGRVIASYLSMSDGPVKGFPAQETLIPYTSDALNDVVARWIVAVADGTCPR